MSITIVEEFDNGTDLAQSIYHRVFIAVDALSDRVSETRDPGLQGLLDHFMRTQILAARLADVVAELEKDAATRRKRERPCAPEAP